VLPDGTVARGFAYPDANTVVETDPQGRTFTSTFDARARILSSTTPAGTLTRVYDDAHQQVRVTAPDGSSSVVGVDRGGRMTQLDLGSGTGTFQYDYGNSRNFPDTVTAPNGDHLTWQKNADGRISQVALNGAPVHEVRFDALGRVASERQRGELRTYRYDATGRISQQTNAAGTTSYGRDAAGRMTTITTDGGITQTYTYDAAGRPTAVDNGAGEHYEVTYDRSGRIIGGSDATGRHVAVAYDANGRRSRVSDDGGLSMAWSFPPSADLENDPPPATVTDFEGITWSYVYDDQERINSVTDPTGGVTSYQRDAAGLVTRITDPLGRNTVFTNGPSGLQQYTSPSVS
jgi:YD repeat-containing protein